MAQALVPANAGACAGRCLQALRVGQRAKDGQIYICSGNRARGAHGTPACLLCYLHPSEKTDDGSAWRRGARVVKGKDLRSFVHVHARVRAPPATLFDERLHDRLHVGETRGKVH